ncbi:MAG: phosphate ABC transporter permease subunit PstC [Chitinophagales bacterium]|nr:phosphate ABC transporter permease subunit PstC [Chitinophagales bacterium]
MNNRTKDQIARYFFAIAGYLSIIILLGIFLILLVNGFRTFTQVGLFDFLFTSEWNPSAYKEPAYGILSMLVSTLLVTVLSMLIAVPLGIGAAAYLSEVAPPKVKLIFKPAIEILAGIPSVTIGFLGIVLTGPFLANTFGLNSGLNALNGAILLAVMALPTIISVAEDAISSVPKDYKDASLALGANKWITLSKITLPAAASGIIAAIILGMGRAIGETMTVLMATGNALAMPTSLFDSVRTMTATIAIELGEVPYGTIHYNSLFAVGLLLFLITLMVNITAERLAKKYRYNK